ncbi:MAG: hypothetical protein KDA87_27475, partial [Planctomycetales bacterium]|nr:hypothetical protein [Planctomycetales bacterium]
ATATVVPDQQAVLFYLYFSDVTSKHQELLEAGISAGDLCFPFYCPQGEFRVTDPDGYIVMCTHT